MTTDTRSGGTPADRSIIITRVFDAPRALVFRAWTDPDQVVQWWGPDGFTTTTHEIDVRPGGVWRFIMHGPDGVDYENKIVYLEIVEPERLVYVHGDEGDPDQFRTTVTFTERNGSTALTMEALFPSAADRDKHVEEFGAIEGGNQHLGRLAEYLAR
ncbi:MAG: SRPBCC domain-containing protein [Chloroflexi bacterium]|nr:SRPBCC domain-containing protein [Chloroflexota bacterium]